ncbi:MAG: cupin domain-containing protein [Phycisphaerales bacterium JB037]
MTRDDLPEVINLADKLGRFADAWNPRIIGQLNGQDIRLARLEGPFIWHAHEREDEAFLVLEGSLRMELRDDAGTETARTLVPGELIIVPRGLEHRPVATPTCSVLLFEPTSTLNTGTAGGERTRAELDRI